MRHSIRACAVAIVAAALALPAAAAAAPGPFIQSFHHETLLSTAVPPNGDVNPYGVAVVPASVGLLHRGDVLVSNFNDSGNLQGTGSTIVEISPSGRQRLFATVPQPTPIAAVGLTTALVALRNGDVVVGSLPAPGGALPSGSPVGALTVLDSWGRVVRTIAAPDINGPWDMTAVDFGRFVTLFVTNVMNGTVAAGGSAVPGGTVVRIRLWFGADGPQVIGNRVIATGFGERTDPAALVVGPTGVGLGAGGVLYVADSAGNRIAAIPQAFFRDSALGGGGLTVAANDPAAGPLNDPLGLAIAPNGDIVTANGNDGNIVETTPSGQPAAVRTLVSDGGGGGDLFGIAVAPHGSGLYFVNDIGDGPDANSLELLH